MPNAVRWFARGGRRYSNAVTVSPICAPSRASLMTGLHVHNHGVLTNADGRRLPQRKTLQRRLGDAGYRTGLFGKFINSWRSDSGRPLKPDPMFWDEFRFAGGSSCMYPQHPCARPDEWKRYNVNGSIRTVNTYPTTFIAGAFSSFIDDGDEPWFAYLCPPNPHAPFGIEEGHSDAPVGPWDGNPATHEDTPEEKADKPAFIRAARGTFAQGKTMREKQLRSLMSVDDMVESVFRKLEDVGQLDDTLAFLLSDNGMLWSEHTWLRKRVPYKQAIRIPFYVRGRGFAPGTTSARLVANIDLAPTAYRAADLHPPDDIDGRPLQDDSRRGHLLTQYFAENGGVPTWASIVTRSAKYTEYYESGGTPADDVATFTEYYENEPDRWELENRKDPPPQRPFAEQLAIDRSSAPPVPDGVIRKIP
jgi:arylsulfatase A-like enzyme